jgi:hypothetical protein
VDVYHIYSVIKYGYIRVTGQRNTLDVDFQGRLDHLLPSSEKLEAPQVSFQIIKEGSYFV